jgi:hypothetical protein
MESGLFDFVGFKNLIARWTEPHNTILNANSP